MWAGGSLLGATGMLRFTHAIPSAPISPDRLPQSSSGFTPAESRIIRLNPAPIPPGGAGLAEMGNLGVA